MSSGKLETGKLKAEEKETQVSGFSLQVLPPGVQLHRGVCPVSGKPISFRYRLVGPDYVPEYRAPKKPDFFQAIANQVGRDSSANLLNQSKALLEARDRTAQRPACRRARL